ncbi:AcrR family transcriptional regulator [Prauserella sediminis]|uniref:AcrR family transcriptional regulator n=1 Tax=Prauserella sediminis TaxID=577680 RepID=A0A839XRH1_9PSEU|nr:TetR family transcriptional regulator C-terminal domain-containing protein [Prauserella sediminis]MBB3665307.1 AcrR family transcriptional regulator [Prauserella sediminis]
MSEGQRRDEIMSAVERLLARGGIDAVTMRAVATEAGVSLRLVQYYGRTKDELLSATLDRLADRSIERWRERSLSADPARSTLGRVRDFLHEALPTDEASRGFHRVGVSLEALAITQPGAAGRAYQRHLDGLADHLADTLRSGTHLDAASARLLALEAMALAHGLGTLLMAGRIGRRDAESLTEDYLERLRPRLSP